MKTTIRCEVASNDFLSFYLDTPEGSFFLFHQAYKSSAYSYYGRGVRLQEALDFSKSHRNTVVLKIMQKLPSYIKYVEKEQGIVVLEQTERKRRKAEKRHTRPAATLTRALELPADCMEEAPAASDGDMTA